MELVQGKATVLGRDTETHGYVGGSGGNVSGHINSFRTATLDIGGTTVTVKHKEPIVVVDGDHVVVAGVRKANGIQAFALANRSRSTRNDAPATMLIVLGSLVVLLSIPAMIIIIGLLTGAIGGYVLYTGLKMRKANLLIQEALAGGMSTSVS
ncbi:MAG: hypothetical protein NVV60_06520 [Luteimonas sp.]|nr:hypothetical protein [Luteimonas sp.]